MYFRFINIFILLLFGVINTGFGQFPEKPFTVIIDPGHGGKDPGTMNKNVKEKDIVLKISLELGAFIKEKMPDVRVIYTRETDIFIPLHERAAIANRNKADLFLSIHVNHSGKEHILGTETYILGFHNTEENLKVAKKENAVILFEDDYSTRYEGFDPNSPESYIMFEMAQDESRLQSIELGLMVQNRFQVIGGRNDRGVLQAGFLVLKEITMPGVLIEAGYLSNPTEAQYLVTDTGQKTLAYAIFNAVQAYKYSVENKRVSTSNSRAVSFNSEGIIKYLEVPVDMENTNDLSISSLQHLDNIEQNKQTRMVTTNRRRNRIDEQNAQQSDRQIDLPINRKQSIKARQLAAIQKNENTLALVRKQSNDQPTGQQTVTVKTRQKPAASRKTKDRQVVTNRRTLQNQPGRRAVYEQNIGRQQTYQVQQQVDRTVITTRPQIDQNLNSQIHSQTNMMQQNQQVVNQQSNVLQQNQQTVYQPINTYSQQPITNTQPSVSINEGIYYSVQIMASRDRISLNSDRFAGLSSLYEVSHDGWYKYLCYKETSMKIIEMYLFELTRRFPDAFIVAHKNGQRILLSEGMKILNP